VWKGGGAMNVYLVSEDGVAESAEEDLPGLLERPDVLIWVDIPVGDPHRARVLSEVFGFHHVAVRNCVERNHVAKLHLYDDHALTVLHAPQVGDRGHVHYVELDQFLGRNYLVTVHGPLNPVVDPAVALVDTGSVLERIRSGELHPRTPFDLSFAIVSALIQRESDMVAGLARESGGLEQRVMMREAREDPEGFVEDLFEVWYELLAIRTIAAHSSTAYARLAKLIRFLPEEDLARVAELADGFEVVKKVADDQREFLHGVIEFYRTRTDTHMTLAAEKTAATAVKQNDDMRKITAWVAIVAVPTAVTGYFGQNVPYPGFSHRAGFIASTLIIVLIASWLYVYLRHREWL
jgi:magnesium transporter